MANQMENRNTPEDSNHSITQKVAELVVTSEAVKVKQMMYKDGFQDVWSPRKQGEWVLNEVKDGKKQIKYASFLCSIWVLQARGMLVDRSGRLIRSDILAEAAEQATQQIWDLLTAVTNEPKTPAGKVPSVEDILQWQRYASMLKDHVASTGAAVQEVTAAGGLQVAAVAPGKSLYPELPTETVNEIKSVEVESAPSPKPRSLVSSVKVKSETNRYDQNDHEFFPTPDWAPKPPPYQDIDPGDASVGQVVAKPAPSAPMAPITIPLPGYVVPGVREATATGEIGVYCTLYVRDLASIVSSLPVIKKNNTNSEFWDRLWVIARTHKLAIKDLYTICEQMCPPSSTGQVVHMAAPAAPPTSEEEFSTQFAALRARVQKVIGSGIQTFTNVTTIKQKSDEPFMDYAERFACALKEFVAAQGGPDLDSSVMLHTAQSNLNSQFSQILMSSLPTIANWEQFIQWGTRAQDMIERQKTQNTVAAVTSPAAIDPFKQAPPTQAQSGGRPKCSYCDKMGHLIRKCWAKRAEENPESSYRFQKYAQNNFVPHKPAPAVGEAGSDQKLNDLLKQVDKLTRALQGSQ